VAYVFEVMRYLIAGDDAAVQPGAAAPLLPRPCADLGRALCDAVQAHPRAATWARWRPSRAPSCEVETQAFDMLET
jgi:hypothetical protein